MPLGDDVLAVDFAHPRVGPQLGHVGAEPHGAALVVDVALRLHEVDHRVRRGRIEFGRVRPLEVEDVAAEVDGHALEAQAEAQAGNLLLTRIAGCGDLPLDATRSETARDDDAVEVAQPVGDQQALDVLRLDPLDLDVDAVVDAGMVERFDHRQVGIDEADVLADEADTNRDRGGLDPAVERLPLLEVGFPGIDAKQVADRVVEALVVEDEGDLVEAVGVGGADDRRQRHTRQVRDLAAEGLAHRLVAAADDGIRLDAPAAELDDRVLGGLGLVLTRWGDVRHQGDMDVADVVQAHVEAELPYGLEEREDLDVADGAADLGDEHVDVVVGQQVDATLDLVGDVWNHLHGLAQVVAVPLSGQDMGIDRSGGGVRIAGEVLVDEPLVVAEVEVGLATVVGDEDLAVLERVHGSRIDVDVRVQLLDQDPESPLLEESTQGGGSEALSERTGNAARDEDVFGHGTRTYR